MFMYVSHSECRRFARFGLLLRQVKRKHRRQTVNINLHGMTDNVERLKDAMNSAFCAAEPERSAATEFILMIREADLGFLFETVISFVTQLSDVEQLRALFLLKMVLTFLNSESVEKETVQSYATVIDQCAGVLLAEVSAPTIAFKVRNTMADVLAANLKLQIECLNERKYLQQIIEAQHPRDTLLAQVLLDFVQDAHFRDDIAVAISSFVSEWFCESTSQDVLAVLMSILDVLFKSYWGECSPVMERICKKLFSCWTSSPTVESMRLVKRLIKCTDGLLVKESGDLEPVLLETMVAIGHQSDRQLIVELCALSNTMINYVYCDGNIPIAYNNVIMQLYSVLLGVDNGVWDPSDWSPQAASLHAIINYGQAVVSSETFAEFHAMFYPLLHSSKYSERFVSAVMMSVASANRTSDGSYFLMYVKDLIELARDETPRVREQALLGLTDGMRASFRHSLEPQYLEMTNHIFTGTLHLCEDLPEIRASVIRLYQTIARVPGFPKLDDLFANIYRMISHVHLIGRSFVQVSNMISKCHISFLPSTRVLLEEIIKCGTPFHGIETTVTLLQLLTYVVNRGVVINPYKQAIFETLSQVLEIPVPFVWANAVLPFSTLIANFSDDYPSAPIQLVPKILEFLAANVELCDPCFVSLIQIQSSIPAQLHLQTFSTIAEILANNPSLSSTSKALGLSVLTFLLSQPFAAIHSSALTPHLLHLEHLATDALDEATTDSTAHALTAFLTTSGTHRSCQ